MKGSFTVTAMLLIALAMPASAQLTSQQQKMKDCNTQASGMSGDARKQFMSTCLSGGAAETKGPHCTKGKPYGNSCIAMVRGELGARWHRKRHQQHRSRGKTPFHRRLSR